MQTTQSKPTSTIPSEAIATAAYYEWLKAGKPAGRDQEFWLKAEAKLNHKSDPGTAKKPVIVRGGAKAIKL